MQDLRHSIPRRLDPRYERRFSHFNINNLRGYCHVKYTWVLRKKYDRPGVILTEIQKRKSYNQIKTVLTAIVATVVTLISIDMIIHFTSR